LLYNGPLLCGFNVPFKGLKLMLTAINQQIHVHEKTNFLVYNSVSINKIHKIRQCLPTYISIISTPLNLFTISENTTHEASINH